MGLRDDRTTPSTFGYLDESGSSQRYFGMGLLIHGPNVSGAADHRLNGRVREIRSEFGFGVRSDLGWKKLPSKPGNYLDGYLRLIDGFFEHEKLSFHSIVVDTAEYPLDSSDFFQGRKDVGMDGFAYHLIRSRALPLRPMNRLYLRIDQRSRPAEASLGNLRGRIVNAIKEAGGSIALNLRRVNGRRHPLIHLCDLLLGAVTASLNHPPKSVGKQEVLSLIQGHLGRQVAAPTGLGEEKFSVWWFSPGSGERSSN